MGVWLSKASKGCGKALGGVEGVAEGSRACRDVGSLSSCVGLAALGRSRG